MVFIPVLDGVLCNPAFGSSASHSRGNRIEQTFVIWLRQNVFGAEREFSQAVSLEHIVRNRLMRELGDCITGGDLHFLVDGRGA